LEHLWVRETQLFSPSTVFEAKGKLGSSSAARRLSSPHFIPFAAEGGPFQVDLRTPQKAREIPSNAAFQFRAGRFIDLAFCLLTPPSETASEASCLEPTPLL
jgi:hypothetical protein